MSISIRKAAFGGLALAAVGAVLAGCAAAPTESPAPSNTPTLVANAGFLPCMVSDAGGFDDHSFNELGLDGLQAAAKELGVQEKHVQSNSSADYAPNIQTLLGDGCTLIITVGFNLSQDTVTAALANPNVNFAIVDDAADNDFDGKTDAPNIKPLLFDTAQAAFLAGLRRRGLLEGRQGRHLRRRAVPDRLDLHGRLRAGASTTSTPRRARPSRSSAGTRRRRRARSSVTAARARSSRAVPRPARSARACSTRAST